jgi:hypothetical protein
MFREVESTLVPTRGIVLPRGDISYLIVGAAGWGTARGAPG